MLYFLQLFSKLPNISKTEKKVKKKKSIYFDMCFFSRWVRNANKNYLNLLAFLAQASDNLELLQMCHLRGIWKKQSRQSKAGHNLLQHIVNSKLDTRISFVRLYVRSCVTLRVPPLYSETGWTGELWLNPVLLILEN